MSFHKTNPMQFSLQKVIEDLKHYLPSQTPIKDFIHHNSLHAFQDISFYEGIFSARDIFGYNVTLSINEFRNLYNNGRINKGILEQIIIQKKGVQHLNTWLNKTLYDSFELSSEPNIGRLRKLWKLNYQFDIDNHVQPTLFRFICSYLDQGVSITSAPIHDKGFLTTIRNINKNSFFSLIKSPRVKVLLSDTSTTIEDLLKIIVGNESYYAQYLFDQQFSHRGWSGMVATIEDKPNSLLESQKVTLSDFIHFELLLEIDALDQRFGNKWQPLCEKMPDEDFNIFKTKSITEFEEVLMMLHDAFEWSYYDNILSAIQKNYAPKTINNYASKFQAIFCIDERECSFRRHLERVASDIDTFGTPGFFGVDFYFQAEGAFFYEKLCPAPVTPKILIKETNSEIKRKHSYLYNKITHTLIGGALFNIVAGIMSVFELFRNILKPKMTPAISNAFSHVGKESILTIENKDIRDRENDLQIGFTIEEMYNRVESQLLNIGLVNHFAPIVYIIAHGSSSANNPHHGAHDCGACSGRPGSVNARVFAYMANHPEVRSLLKRKGINIPETTQFVGALHDTAADQIAFFDLSTLNNTNKKFHADYVIHFENALDYNAKERSRRFASITTKNSLKRVRRSILNRSVSLFEPRPELGHGSNALCIIGRREISKNIFLDRRAFLNSYDYTLDPEGVLLKNIIQPIGPVCGGINLEYYFSRIDNQKLGAGTKLPHNVMGLIGVANSSDGDLRPGLPLQMIEVHDPVRLLVIVEQKPEVVLQVIQSNNSIYDWYAKNWIHLAVISPLNQEIYVFKNDKFELYQTNEKNIEIMHDIDLILENAKEMSSFSIEDATQENLSVFQLK